jgi:hypothetical protein
MACPLCETTGAQEAGGRFKMRRGRGPIVKRSVQGNGIDDGRGASMINACRIIAKRCAVAALVDNVGCGPCQWLAMTVAASSNDVPAIRSLRRMSSHRGYRERIRSVTIPDN